MGDRGFLAEELGKVGASNLETDFFSFVLLGKLGSERQNPASYQTTSGLNDGSDDVWGDSRKQGLFQDTPRVMPPSGIQNTAPDLENLSLYGR